ncbi:MAG: hypothetical protein ACRCYO_06235 [Bacteroidia bacterium]
MNPTIPTKINFVLSDTLYFEGKKLLSIQDEDSIISYTGDVVFFNKQKETLKSVHFESPFNTPIAKSKSGKYILGGIEYYDCLLNEKDRLEWPTLLTSFPERTTNTDKHWTIYNAIWDEAMRFTIVYSGYEGPMQDLTLKQRSDFLHYLVMVDSTQKKQYKLASLSNREDITDMALADSILIAVGKNICWWNLNEPDKQHFIPSKLGQKNQVFLHQKLNLAACTDKSGNLTIWDINRSFETFTAQIHQGAIYDVVFHPTLPVLFTNGEDHKLKCWWWEDNKLIELVHDLNEENEYSVSGFDDVGKIVLTSYSKKGKAKQRYSIKFYN